MHVYEIDVKTFLETSTKDDDYIIDGDNIILSSLIHSINAKKSEIAEKILSGNITKIKTNLIGIGSPDIEYLYIKFHAFEEILTTDIKSLKMIYDYSSAQERELSEDEISQCEAAWIDFSQSPLLGILCQEDGTI